MEREGDRAAPGAPTRIGQIAVPVRDVERATAFYRDVLGLRHLFTAPPGLSFFQCGEVRIMLAAPESPDEEPAPAPLVYYRVEDLEEADRRLKGGGARVVADPHRVHAAEGRELWMGFYGDSEGSTFATMAEIDRGTAAE